MGYNHTTYSIVGYNHVAITGQPMTEAMVPAMHCSPEFTDHDYAQRLFWQACEATPRLWDCYEFHTIERDLDAGIASTRCTSSSIR